MDDVSRRDFLRHSYRGLAALGMSTFVLRADAQPTEASGHLDDAARQGVQGTQSEGLLREKPVAPTNWMATEDNILGPYYREGAPYRAKITPPLEPGKTLLVRGRVWGFDTKKPLTGVVLDIWQANAQGRYDNDDPDHPPTPGLFVNRARLRTDETGYYEYETIHPGQYKTSPTTWRPAHIHYLVRHTGYKELVTQLYFKGDPYNTSDAYIKPSLIRDMEHHTVGAQSYELVTFDVVLAP
jgi:catechol 1,2-dioxygenase